MAPTARALARRFAAALMLLAVLVLGLHEAFGSAHGAPPPAVVALQQSAALDHDEADRGPIKYPAVICNTNRVCLVGRPLPPMVAVVTPITARVVLPSATALPTGVDPAGLRRPPRAIAIA
ncbi:hypothetical protein [Roseicella aerolata]|uniref:DUF2946 domain-containing protein n=1 Tax=Roseicella aerolata TaxID=2883479 RepID=A0A9X1IH96_9PROT|nr:hypothetical protein [Roseicella aerolata]MCB4824547.1 hypothetical protein [Roseicella aerolata]